MPYSLNRMLVASINQSIAIFLSSYLSSWCCSVQCVCIIVVVNEQADDRQRLLGGLLQYLYASQEVQHLLIRKSH